MILTSSKRSYLIYNINIENSFSQDNKNSLTLKYWSYKLGYMADTLCLHPGMLVKDKSPHNSPDSYNAYMTYTLHYSETSKKCRNQVGLTIPKQYIPSLPVNSLDQYKNPNTAHDIFHMLYLTHRISQEHHNHSGIFPQKSSADICQDSLSALHNRYTGHLQDPYSRKRILYHKQDLLPL